MEEQEYVIAPDRVAVKLSEWDALVAYHRATEATMKALFAEDQAGFDRLTSLMSNNPREAMVSVQAALDQAIRERDAARRAALAFDEAGKPWSAALVRGEV